jgi:hypothetical protein
MKGPTLNFYLDRPDRSLEVKEILKSLSELGLNVKFKGDFFKSQGISIEKIAVKLAVSRILNISRMGSLNVFSKKSDVEYEKNTLESSKPMRLIRDLSNVYDGYELAQLLRAYVNKEFHIIFTSRMFSTFEGTRYHGRTIVVDFPLAIISTTGIVEAPAKPQEFYMSLGAYYKAKEAGYEVPEEKDFINDLKDKFADRFIDYEDPRLTQIIKGYSVQAIFYLLFGEAFCGDRDCILYNAHTQKDMIHAQIESGQLCNRHKKYLQKNFFHPNNS